MPISQNMLPEFDIEMANTRIAQHLGMMLGAFIATLTAFIVTNFTFNPVFVLCLAPSAVITPVIIWRSRKIREGVRPKSMPSS